MQRDYALKVAATQVGAHLTPTLLQVTTKGMHHPAHWAIFAVVVLFMLFLDLGVFHKKSHEVSVREALVWSAVWIALSLGFAYAVFVWEGREHAVQFLTAYILEKSLSIDNIFVFLLIFTYFKIPAASQHKILYWGIIGALAMRAVFIAVGISLVTHFKWMFYVFGGLLLFTGIKMLKKEEEAVDLEANFVIRIFRKFIPVTTKHDTQHFFVRHDGKRYATPLLVTLVAVETSDLIFALDSIPAVLAITTDTFIVYTSNVFAILGLRSLYFAVAGVMRSFQHLHYGLAAIIMFIGVKMLVNDKIHVPTHWTLLFIAVCLAGSIVASVLDSRASKRPPSRKR
jgi:tellurite resistance protein TerC